MQAEQGEASECPMAVQSVYMPLEQERGVCGRRSLLTSLGLESQS